MKIKKLVLEKYGHFANQAFDFEGTTGLHILYGPNEAGKTTVLDGMSDVLFGIDARSSYNFLHDYGEMRLLAELENSAGESITFRRRKGNKNTLIDTEDNVVPESALFPFIGNADKALFKNMFGLSHQELRRGGHAMVEADGDAADSLFGAAAGLASVLSLSTDLKTTADDLFTPRKSKLKPFYVAFDSRKQGLIEMRNKTVSPTEWRDIEDEAEQVKNRELELDEEFKELRVREAQANRSLRVRPIIARIGQLKEEISNLGSVPDLAAGSISRRCLTSAPLGHIEGFS